MECYNHSSVQIEHVGAVCCVLKARGKAPEIHAMTNGTVTLDTTDFSAGEYQVQFYNASDDVIGEDTLTVKQSLKYATASYDGRSNAQIALEAITAFMEGRATAQQRRIQVGDKAIEYSSFDELLKWKAYFEAEIRKEEGKAKGLRHEKIYWRGI